MEKTELKIKIHKNGETIEIATAQGKQLLEILQKNGLSIFAPCGGQGVCAKCRVFVKSIGNVTACGFYPENDLEVYLPDDRESAILVAQNKHTISVPFYPGEASMKAPLPYGLAIDLGTTSLVFYFVNLITGQQVETHSQLNPQGKFGADVISRINHCQQKNDGLNQLQAEILQTIDKQITTFAEKHGITTQDLVKITVAGNPTMLHLLLGVDPTGIAQAPYTPAFIEEQKRTGAELNLSCLPDAEIKILPSISAYIGSDIVGGLASLKLDKKEKNVLFVDIGTNGEMALITPEKIYSCSTAAGPALEGATIACGTGAISGAISVYKDGKFKTIANEKPVGICGSGLIDLMAYLFENKHFSPDGYMENDFMVDEENNIRITPQDIREVQLAKSAIVSGLKVLIQQAGLTFDNIDTLYLAGGFGNYIDLTNALKIGLLPAELEGKIIAVGNTSGTGALLSMKSTMFDEYIRKVIGKTEYIELSMREDFNMEFVMNMDFAY